MSGGYQVKDTKNIHIPVFAPKRVDTVVSGTPWVPEDDDRVFMATADVNMIITTTSAQTSVGIPEYTPFGIVPGATYTFDAAIEIMVM